jgi:CBS-domain-containing membrane protein
VKNFALRFFQRHQGPRCIPCWLKAGIGAFAAFAIAFLLSDAVGASMIVAPMGASAALIYGTPESPLAQPAHVIGGHVIAAVIALAANQYLPASPWMMAGTIGVTIALLGLIHLNHPPAAATVLVVLLTHPSWMFLLTPLLSGIVTLVVIALFVHRLPPRTVYPMPAAAKLTPPPDATF